MRKFLLTTILIFTSFLCTGCFDFNNLEDATIYTTVYPIQYLAQVLYNDYSTSSMIYPNGALVDEYELTDKQINNYSKGTLFVYNGTTNEKQIAKSLINANNKLKIIDVAYGLKYNYGVEELWLSPSNFLMLATNFKDNLENLVDSKYVNEAIDSKYHKLEETLSIMDADIRKIASKAKENNKNTIVATTKVFKFLENYGFNVICLEDYEENSANLNTLKNSFSSGNYKYLLKENIEEENKTIKELKVQNNATIIDVNMMNTLTDNEVSKNADYLTIMNEFINNLKVVTE